MSEYMPKSVERRREFMLSMATALSQRAWELINLGNVTMQRKPDGSKVTSVDLELNAMFNGAAQAEFPRDFVRGEESGVAPADLPVQEFTPASNRGLWVIDPIDKTNNFWRGCSTGHFGDSNATVQIAWFAPGENTPTISTILSPFNETPSQLMADPTGAYYRANGTPTFRRIHVPDGPTSLAGVRRYDTNYWPGADSRLEHVDSMFPYARRINHPMAYGAVALGDADLGIFPGTHPHDVAPNAHIVHRAGGFVQTLSGVPYHSVDWRMEPVGGLVAANNEQLGREFVNQLNSTYPAQ